MPTFTNAKTQNLKYLSHLLWEYSYSEKEDPRMLMARNIALHHHQTFNGKGYPRRKRNGAIQAPLYKDYAGYLINTPLSETDIPTEALIVGLADRYDALRSRRPYK